MMKHDLENKTTTDFLVGNANEMNLYGINSIECKTRSVCREKYREINKWGESKHTKIYHYYPDLLETVIEKCEVMQCFHHASVFGFSKTLLLIGNISEITLKGIWIIFPKDVKIYHLSTLKTCYNVSMKWKCEDLPAPKSLENMAKK